MRVCFISPGTSTKNSSPDASQATDMFNGYDRHALAYVVRGILDLTGLKVDPEGRLLS